MRYVFQVGRPSSCRLMNWWPNQARPPTQNSRMWCVQVGQPEIDDAADFLVKYGRRLVKLAEKTRPDLLVQVPTPHQTLAHARKMHTILALL